MEYVKAKMAYCVINPAATILILCSGKIALFKINDINRLNNLYFFKKYNIMT